MGKVARVLPGMQSAFIEIGLERAAFLHVADIWEHRQNGRGATGKPIEESCRRAAATGAGDQGPDRHQGRAALDAGRVAGRLLVYLPQDPHIGISQRIEDEAGRAALREKLKELIPADEKGGFILRTLAESASERGTARRHRVPAQSVARYRRALAGAHGRQARLPGPVARPARAARHGDRRPLPRCASTRARTTEKLAAFARPTCRACSARLEHYAGERPLFELYNVEQEIEQRFRAAVDLKSGG